MGWRKLGTLPYLVSGMLIIRECSSMLLLISLLDIFQLTSCYSPQLFIRVLYALHFFCFQDASLQRLIKDSVDLRNRYRHFFDYTIINTTIEETVEHIIEHLQQLEQSSEWVPAVWYYWHSIAWNISWFSCKRHVERTGRATYRAITRIGLSCVVTIFHSEDLLVCVFLTR